MSLNKDLRFLILIFLAIFAAYLVFSPYIFKKSGVLVSFVENDTSCVKENDIITNFEGLQIKNSDDFRNILQHVQANTTVSLNINGFVRDCPAVGNTSLGFLVKDLKYSNLKFGIDIAGGTRVLLEPKNETSADKLTETVGILNQRINLFGLSDIQVSIVGSNLIQIESAGATGDDIRNFLAKQGKFEGKILYSVDFSGDNGQFQLGDSAYNLVRNDSTLIVGGTQAKAGDTFTLAGFNFEVINVTNVSAALYGDIFTGSDIVAVLTDPQYSRVTPVQNGYQFTFSIQITPASAQRFATMTKNQPTETIGNQLYIKPKLVLFLD